MIRDRKMYVAPTPYAVAQGTTGRCTLIVPANTIEDERLTAVGQLTRIEADRLVVGYHFNLTTNELSPEYVPNPAAGTEHTFTAYRVAGEAGDEVRLARSLPPLEDDIEE